MRWGVKMLCNKEKFVNLEKTSDELLECVVAGSKRLCKKVRFAGIVATIFSVPISFGCMVAGKICKEKAKTQKQQEKIGRKHGEDSEAQARRLRTIERGYF